MEEGREGRNTTTTDTLLDLLTNCFPPNLIQVQYHPLPPQWRVFICYTCLAPQPLTLPLQATMQQYKTQLVYPGNVRVEDPSSGAMLDPLVR